MDAGCDLRVWPTAGPERPNAAPLQSVWPTAGRLTRPRRPGEPPVARGSPPVPDPTTNWRCRNQLSQSFSGFAGHVTRSEVCHGAWRRPDSGRISSSEAAGGQPGLCVIAQADALAVPAPRNGHPVRPHTAPHLSTQVRTQKTDKRFCVSLTVIEEALRAARRVNDFSTAVRVFEGLSAFIGSLQRQRSAVTMPKHPRLTLSTLS